MSCDTTTRCALSPRRATTIAAHRRCVGAVQPEDAPRKRIVQVGERVEKEERDDEVVDFFQAKLPNAAVSLEEDADRKKL